MTSEYSPTGSNEVKAKKHTGKKGAALGALIGAVYLQVSGVAFADLTWEHAWAVSLAVLYWLSLRYGNEDGARELIRKLKDRKALEEG